MQAAPAAKEKLSEPVFSLAASAAAAATTKSDETNPTRTTPPAPWLRFFIGLTENSHQGFHHKTAPPISPATWLTSTWQPVSAHACAEIASASLVQRYYASNFGRFMSPDRGKPAPGNPGSFNRYPYVQGDPINNGDPRGLFTLTPMEEPTPGQEGGGGGEDGSEGGCVIIDGVNYGCQDNPCWTGDWDNFTGAPDPAACPAEPEPPPPSPPPPDCLHDLTPQQLLGVPFVEGFYADASTLAAKGGIPQDWILGWSGDESSWGTSPIARKQHNYFGWHGRGNVRCGPGSNPRVGCFSDYYASGLTALFSTDNFFRYNGQIGVSSDTILLGQSSSGASVAQAFQALANAGYNGSPSYGSTIANWVKDVDAIENCLQSKGLLP